MPRSIPSVLSLGLFVALLSLAAGQALAAGPTQEQLAAAAKSAGSINGLDPVSRKLVTPAGGTALYKGEKIAFASKSSEATFAAEPTRFMDRMRLNPPKYWYVSRNPSVVNMRKAKKTVGSAHGRCPVMGKVVVPKGGNSTYRGQKIQFCCPPCKAKFDKDPEKYMRLMRADPLAYAYDRPGPTATQMRVARTSLGCANGRCPVMGKLVVAKGGSATYKGETVAFCCPPCEGRFLKNPEKYMRRMRSEPAAYGYVTPQR